MALEWYTLKHRKPVKTDVFTAAFLLSPAGWPKRRIRYHTIGNRLLSTIFLSLDPSFDDEMPVLFETAIYANKSWSPIKRHCTHREAINFHRQLKQEMLKDMKGGEP